MSKRGLGRGLDALLPDGHQVERGERLTQIELNSIVPNPFQPRKEFDGDKLVELSESIKVYGVLQPIVVRRRDDLYELVAGERRWRASQLVSLRLIPAVVRDYSDAEMTAVALVENLQRENLNPIEEANAYRRLIDDFGYTQEEVSQKVGKSRSFIANIVRLLNLPSTVQEYVSRGTMTPGQVRPLLVLPTPELQEEAAAEILTRALNARESEELAKQFIKKKNTGKEKVADIGVSLQSLRDMELSLSKVMGTRVHIVEKGKGVGSINIEYYSEEERQRLFECFESFKNDEKLSVQRRVESALTV